MKQIPAPEIFSLLTQWALRPDASTDLRNIFGGDSDRYQPLLQSIRSGDFSWVPEVQILSASSMGSADGAYSRKTRSIYLSSDCPQEQITSVLLEEIGHHIDALFNEQETPGDEGALFSAAVRGISLSEEEITSILNEDDSAILSLNGLHVAVECAAKPAPPSRAPLKPIVAIKPGSSNLTNSRDWDTLTSGTATLTSGKHGLSLVGSQALVGYGNSGRGGTNTGTNTLSAASNSGDSILRAGTAATTLIGGSGNTTLYGSTAGKKDSIIGGSGSSTIFAGKSLVTMVGGAKNNLIFADTLSSRRTLGQSLWGGNNNGSSLYGNTLIGGAGRDTLRSGSGYNTLISGSNPGVSTTIGATAKMGVTRISVASAAGFAVGQQITGNGIASGTTITAIARTKLTLSVKTTASISTGTRINSVGNILIGQGLSNSLVAGRGNDSLSAVSGNSTLLGGTGNTTLLGGGAGSKNWLQSRSNLAGNTLVGGAGNNTLVAGSGGNDSIVGGANQNLLLVTEDNLNAFATSSIKLSSLASASNTLGISDTSPVTINDSLLGTMATAGVKNLGTVANLSNASTRIILGTNAESVGVSSLVSGSGSDTLSVADFTSRSALLDASNAGNRVSLIGGGSGNIIFNGSKGGYDTMIGASGNDSFTIQAFAPEGRSLGRINGNAGSDTIAFNENGISITDNNFGSSSNIDQVEALRTKNGTNYIQLGTQAAASGMATIIGGSGKDTIEATGFNGSSLTIESGNEADFISGSDAASNHILSGAGDDSIILKDAAAVGHSTVDGGVGTDTLSLSSATTLADTQLGGLSGVEILRAASTGASKFVLGATAQLVSGVRTVIGGNANDTLDASGYNAGINLNGGAGDDNLVLSTGDNLRQSNVVAGSGNDTLSFGIAALSVTDEDFTGVTTVEALMTANGNNRILLGANAQTAGIATLIGGTGRDTFDASGFTTRGVVFLAPDATDSLVGGAGIDTISTGSSFNMSLSSGIEVLNLTSSSAATLTGNDSNNSIFGGAGSNDTLIGKGGNDYLDGRTGADSMVGGTGNDTFVVDDLGDTVAENLSEGTDTVVSKINYTLADNFEVLILGGKDSISGTGNNLDNTLIGNSAQNTLFGGDGNDSITANNPNVLPDISFVGRNVSTAAQNYLTSGSNSLINGLGGQSGYGTSVVNTGDDNSSQSIDITPVFGANGLNFYGNQIKRVFINNNGNITFNNPSRQFTPESIDSGLGTPIIAPFWADVDTRGNTGNVSPGGTSNGANRVFWNIDSTNRVMTVTWDDVGFYARNSTKVNAFQLQLIDSGNGNGFIVFRYEAVNWTTGDSSFSGGTDGLGGNVARAGFNTGTGQSIELPQSGIESAILGLPQTTPNLGLNANAPGVFVFEVMNGQISLGNVTGDSLAGGGGNDTLVGGDGNDTLDGGIGGDAMNGGAGDDTYVVDATGDTIIDSAGTDVVRSSISFDLSNTLNAGGSGIENLVYTGFSAATLTGNALANSIDASAAGVNTLIGGDGNDTLIIDGGRIGRFEGGNGNDTVIFKGANLTLDDSAFEGARSVENYDFSQVTGNLNITLGLFSQAAGITALSGSGNNDIISAPTYTVGIQLDGQEGNDSLTGGNANDTLIGGSGRNTLNGGNGNDLIVITPALVNPSSLDTVNGGNGTDTLQVDLPSTTLVDDDFSSISEIEVLQATSGDNSFTIGATASLAGIRTIYGAAGNDTINATSYTTGVTLIGDAGADSLTGGSGADSLVAGAGNDTLSGGAGKDTLDAGEGVNRLSGGNDDDTFLFSSQNLADTELDGGAGTADTILFTASGVTLGDGLFGNVITTEVLQLGGGNNSVLIGATAKKAGIRTIIGGSGRNTLSAAGDISDSSPSNVAILLDASASSASSLVGGSGADQLIGGSGSDTMDGGTGSDAMQGGDGNDVYYYNESSDNITEYRVGGASDKVFSSIDYVLGNFIEVGQLTGSGNFNLTGHSNNDFMDGFFDTLIGNDRDNVLADGKSIRMLGEGPFGSVMQGGMGNDTYIVKSQYDEITEKKDEGIDVIEAHVNYTLGGGGEKIILVEAGSLSPISAGGNGDGNTLVGNSSANILDGAGGADTMIGGLGNDTYVVDNTGDIMTETVNQGTDLVQVIKTGNLTNGNVTTYILADGNNIENLQYVGLRGNSEGTSGIAFLIGNELDNSILGGRGNDTLRGGALGNDTLNGGEGDDFLAGGYGNDYYVVDSALDVVDEKANAGRDTVAASVSYTLSGGVEYLVLSGTGNLDGTGSNDDNILEGNDQNNRLDGSRGADSMAGGRGDDIYVVDNAVDMVKEFFGEGTDLIYSSETYTLDDNVEHLILTGTADIDGTGNSTANQNIANSGVGANSLIGNSGKNNLTGGDGNDTLDGGAGVDIMTGGDGNDVYYVDNAVDMVKEFFGEGTDLIYSSETYTLDDNVEHLILTGTADIDGTGNSTANQNIANSGVGANSLIGNSGKNNLTGGDGNDTLDGGAGVDNMTGGAGNDLYYVDNADDTVVENLTLVLGGGTDAVRTLVDFDISVTGRNLTNVENITHLGSANLKSIGNGEDNVMTGNEGIDTMTGGLGNDTYIVNNFSDFIVEGADTIVDNITLSGGTKDEIQSSATYILSPNVERLVLTGLANINGTGNALNNTLIGNIGDNSLNGAGGADFMAGGAGNDIYTIDDTGDVVFESINVGIDTIYSSKNYILGDNVENLVLTKLVVGSADINGTGNTQANAITGNSGDNELDGGIGTNGVDTLTGLGGADTFILGNASTSYYTTSSDLDYAVITDFSTTQGDRLQLNGSSNLYTIGSLDGTAAQGLSPNYKGLYLGGDLIAAINDTNFTLTTNLGQISSFV